MPSDAPKIIITNQDPAMTKATSKAFPNTFHRYYSPHILNKFFDKLSVMFTVKTLDNVFEIWRIEVSLTCDGRVLLRLVG